MLLGERELSIINCNELNRQPDNKPGGIMKQNVTRKQMRIIKWESVLAGAIGALVALWLVGCL